MTSAHEPTPVPALGYAGKIGSMIFFLFSFFLCPAQNHAAHFTGPTFIAPSVTTQTYQCGNIPISGHLLTVEALAKNMPIGGFYSHKLVDKLSNNDTSVFSLTVNDASVRTVTGGNSRGLPFACAQTISVTLNSSCATSTTSTAAFTAPDTVCVNEPVNIVNTSTGATSYFWNFCVADVNTPPSGINLGNIGSNFHSPVYIDYVYEAGNYYGFMTNNYPGGLLRLDFGNSLLNTPTITDLGTVGGVIPNNAEGVQVVKNQGQWYVIIVGGNPAGNIPSAIVKISLGANIANNAPGGTYWGNLGNLDYPHDLYVFDDNGHWYGLTVNTSSNTITRFDFTTSFANTPTAVNLGNIGNMTAPTGLHALNDNGNWYAFVTNVNSNTITRLNFGNSLLNNPTGVNLGNVSGVFNGCWDVYIMKFCGRNVGFVINAGSNELVRLDFGGSMSNMPTGVSLGNIGNLSFPHCISKIFRTGPDLYTFVPNVNNNSLSRLKFGGCTSSNIPNSIAQTPPALVYSSPGIYNINLTVDDGLPTQSSFCKQVVVVAPPPHAPTQQLNICPGSIKIGASVHPATYLWNTGATTDSIVVNTSGTYWVQTTRSGCSVRDSFLVNMAAKPAIDFGFQQNTCQPKTLQFTSALSNVSAYQWNFGDNQTDAASQTPVHTYASYGNYTVILKYQFGTGCSDSVSKTITLENVFDSQLLLNSDTTICLGDSLLIRTSGPVLNSCWVTSTGLNPAGVNAYVKPTGHTVYALTAQAGGPNLVVNGNFSSGNTGFSSDYVFAAPNTTEGQYWVGTNPASWNGGLSNCGDHSTGSGAMMMVNGSPAADAKVWSQTISVMPNTNYSFSTWLASLSSPNPARLQFSINNVNLGNSIAATSTTCQWNQFSSTWNSGSNTTATISIVNNNTAASGNDFALDDIYFGTVKTRTDSFTVDVTGLCDSIKITGTDKVCSPSDTLTYSIYRSPRCTQPFSILVDNAYATIVSQTATAVRIAFHRNGATAVKVAFANSCKLMADSVNVAIRFSPTSIDFGPDINTCSDTSFVLHAGSGFGTYAWQDGSTDSVYTVQGPGLYYVSARSICGASFSDSLRLTKSFPRPFQVVPLNATACEGDSVVFRASGGTAYAWQPAGHFSYPDSPATKALVDVTQDFTLSISDSICRRDTLITIPVTASQVSALSISKSNDVTCSNDSAVLVASGATTYTWWPGLYVSRAIGGQITVKPPQTMTYYVLGKNSIGCTRQDSVTVFFTKDGDQKLYMPTAFTPNGDGLNDVFRPIFTGPATKYDFRVYNRWGQLIFRSTTPGAGWDGTFRSILQPGDAYVYYITAEGGCNGKFEQKGTFVLIR